MCEMRLEILAPTIILGRLNARNSLREHLFGARLCFRSWGCGACFLELDGAGGRNVGADWNEDKEVWDRDSCGYGEGIIFQLEGRCMGGNVYVGKSWNVRDAETENEMEVRGRRRLGEEPWQ